MKRWPYRLPGIVSQMLFLGLSLVVCSCAGTEPGAEATITSTSSTTATGPTSTTSTRPTSTTEAITTTVPTGTTLGAVIDLPGGLFCRDLVGMGYGYAAAAEYWEREGMPERMDADRNGIPCETVYPADQIRPYWSFPTISEVVEPVQVRYDEAFASIPDPPEGVHGAMRISCEDAYRRVGFGDVFACIGEPRVDPPFALDPVGIVFLVLSDDGAVVTNSGTDAPGTTRRLLELYAQSEKGMSCADLLQSGDYFSACCSTPEVNYFNTVLYWFLEGVPEGMDPDGNRRPCEDLYPQSAIDWVWSGGEDQ